MTEVTALTPEVLETETEVDPNAAKQDEGGIPRVTNTAGKPDWCKPFPPNFKIPKGKRPVFIRFRAGWTEIPDMGERQCVCWGITVGEEHIADKRAEDSGTRAVHERAKLSVRLISHGGNDTLVPVDHSKSERDADVDIFWEQIGLKCRTLITQVFLQTHSLSAEERRDFFENCIEVRDAI